MSETYQFKLPLLQAAQAQKHVTVNEALARLDALAQMRVQSRSAGIPTGPLDGHTYIVPLGVTGAWAGQDHKIAMFLNGGWEFATALEGWKAWVIDEMAEVRFASGAWDYTAVTGDLVFGSSVMDTIQFDHTITAGATNYTSVVIPADTVVFGVSGRIIQAISGAAETKIGVDGSTGRYGGNYNSALNTPILGLSSKPQAYFSDTPLRLESEGGDYIDGIIRLCIHTLALTPPAAL